MKKQIFIVGYFLLGLGIPLILMLTLHFGGAEFQSGMILGLSFVGALLGLIGGLLLRQAILVCGALPTLNMGGFEFRRIAKPKMAKAGIDLLPPH